MEDHFLECPFCGEAVAISVSQVAIEDPWFMVFCQSCGAEGPQSDSEEKAKDNWNKRASADELKVSPAFLS